MAEKNKQDASSAQSAVAGFLTSEKLGQVFQTFFKIVAIIEPFAIKGAAICNTIYHVVPYELAKAFLGLSLCFFGGVFTVSIAAFEAFKMCGWEKSKENIKILWNDFLVFKKATAEDDNVDADGDGISDVKQISNSELLQRKVLLFFKKCQDPNRINEAFAALFSAFLAVVAVLKHKFAETIALALSIAEKIYPFFHRILLPILTAAIPKDYQQWNPFVIGYICKFIAISIAWTIERFTSCIQSAINGGLIFSRSILAYLNEKGIIQIDHEDTYLDEIIGYGLAAIGIYVQTTSLFNLFFPFNVLLFPFSFFEYFLTWYITE